MKKPYLFLSAAATLLALLSGCGGGGGGGGGATPSASAPVVVPPSAGADDSADWRALAQRCQHPRAGQAETQGSLLDELKWLRSYYSESYLWYRELPANPRLEDYTDPLQFFAVYKTSAVTASGRLKDRFHFTYASDAWEALSSSGTELGYGITWSRSADTALPRVWTVTTVAPGSPAALAGLRRGDGLASVDGVSLADNTREGVAALNAGLFPAVAGESHRLALTRDGAVFPVSLTARPVAAPPVQDVKAIDTASGKVGYLRFDDHNQLSESELAKAVATLKAADVADLVLDMRYNGGGYLAVASELAYMIAGPAQTAGKVFERLHYNDKTAPGAPDLFRSTAAGFKSSQLAAGAALPYLGLKRVTILTTPGTCSASESVINSLRGIDVEVNLIGGETCGKPYAFVPADNCGTTYFAIQMQGTNNKDFGDYADGFQPTCRADDDLGHALGDTSERLLATALSYRANDVCPAQPMFRRAQAGAGALSLVRPQVKEIAIRHR